MKAFKSFLSELRIYTCNHIISRIPCHALRTAFYRHIMKFELSSGVAVHLGARFDCAGGLSIGENSVINENCRIDSRGGVTIGRNVSISSETIVLSADHDPDSPTFAGRTKSVVIGDYVWIGTRSIILPGVNIERAAVVAAGSVVTKNVSSHWIVAGVPAKPIRKRQEQLDYDLSYRRLLH